MCIFACVSACPVLFCVLWPRVIVSFNTICVCVLCAHLCLWYWRAAWERAVCHLATNAPALPRHVLPNRWTQRATMRKQSVHDIHTYAALQSQQHSTRDSTLWHCCTPEDGSLSSDKWVCVCMCVCMCMCVYACVKATEVLWEKNVDPYGNPVSPNAITIQ